MSAESIRAWKRKPPLRPRAELRGRVVRLLCLCLEARPYLDGPRDVGQWALAPSPRLEDLAPAVLLVERGERGLRLVLAELVDLAPRRETAEVELPAGDELRTTLSAALDDEALAELDRMMADTTAAPASAG